MAATARVAWPLDGDNVEAVKDECRDNGAGSWRTKRICSASMNFGTGSVSSYCNMHSFTARYFSSPPSVRGKPDPFCRLFDSAGPSKFRGSEIRVSDIVIFNRF